MWMWWWWWWCVCVFVCVCVCERERVGGRGALTAAIASAPIDSACAASSADAMTDELPTWMMVNRPSALPAATHAAAT
jgi:hypothetical protein